MTTKNALFLLLLGAAACEPNVVDAVREPPPPETPVEMPPVSPLVSSLLHRYSFEDEGSLAFDSVGAAHGPIVGTTLTDTGTLTLAGNRSLQYVDLPNKIVSGLKDATFEAWLAWDGGAAWQRIFDFGSSSGGEDIPTIPTGGTSGISYLFLTTNAAADSTRGLPSGMRVAYSRNGVGDEDVCFGPLPFPSGSEAHHVAVVVDTTTQTITLYQDGLLITECALSRPLSAINDENNWLGRSNFTNDVELAADYDEFRIYNAALTSAQIAESFAAGPDAKR